MGRVDGQDRAGAVTPRLAALWALLWTAFHALAAGQGDLAGTGGPEPGSPKSSNPFVEAAIYPFPTASTYLVVSSRTDGKGQVLGSTRGVAFAVQQDGAECMLVTANHVIHGAFEVNVYRLNGDMSAGNGYEARVRWKNEARDVAGLMIRNKLDCAPIRPAEEPTQLGQRIYAFLNAPLQRGMVTAGTLGAVWNTDLGPMIVCDMRVHPGQSGSPLLDGKGRLIGMIISRTQSPELSVAYAVPVSAIEAEVAANRPLAVRVRTSDGNEESAP